MTDLVAEFQRRMTLAAGAGALGGTEVLLDLMEPDKAKEFRLCAIPHQFDAKILAALVPGIRGEEAQKHCDELSRLSLVMPEAEGYSLHDTVRRTLFRQWLMPERSAEFAAASARLVVYFETVAANVAGDRFETAQRRRMFHLLGAELEEGFAEFRRLSRRARRCLLFGECANLVTLVREYETVLPAKQMLWLIYYEGRLALDVRHWEDAEQSFGQVLGSANVPPEPQVFANLRLAQIHTQHRNWNEAIRLCQLALELASRTPGLEREMPRIMNELGAAYRDGGDLQRGEEILRESAEIAAKQVNLSGVATAYNSLGNLHLKRRDAKPAIKAFEASLDALTKNQEVLRAAQVYNNLGLAYSDIPDWPRSETYFRRSLEVTQKAGDTLGQANALSNLARAQAGQGKVDEAIKSAQMSITLFEDMHDAYDAAVARRNLGKLYRRLRRPDQARRSLVEAEQSFRTLGEQSDAEEARAEVAALDKKIGLPWWAWFAVVLFVMFVLLIVITQDPPVE